MSSEYQILDNRSIDKWKNGRENTENEEDNSLNSDPQPIDEGGIEKVVPVIMETIKAVVDNSGIEIEKESGVKVQVDINESAASLGHEGIQERDGMVQEDLIAQTTTFQTDVTVTKDVVSEVPLFEQDLQSSGQNENVNTDIKVECEDPKPQLETGDAKAWFKDDGPKPEVETEGPRAEVRNEEPKGQLECVSSKPQLESDDLKPQLDIEDSKVQPENDGSKVPHEDDMQDSSSLNIQPEMVEPSSSDVVPVSGESHPMDVEEPPENKAPIDERDDKNVTNLDMSNKNDSAEMAYSEKLNLDRSSGNESMEEDTLDSKQIDSKCSTDEMGEEREKNGAPIIKEKSHVGVIGDDLYADKKDVFVENKSHSFVPAEKRKLHDQEAVGNNELSKRLKWNSDDIKVPEHQGSILMPTTTPKGTTQPAALRRNFSRSDSAASGDAPKERVVPPSQKAPTTSLRIDNFIRPFTLKAVQELLGKTGTVMSFWMDRIKTHCYVTYSTVEEAIDTRNAVYNLQWPPNGGRLLVADFVDPLEVKTQVDAPPQTPIGTSGTTPQAQPVSQPQPSPRQQISRQQLPPPSVLPPPPPVSNPPPVREWLPLLPPPPKRLDPPIVTLDDLFRKTKATPRIYYLPLSDEQVAAKPATEGGNIKH
ncbi:Detected protein of confused Function [Hibiscus syriacus]|uniref:Detected protein of confused Function n=1 Tax=Hibiscus syriacus TaxID=106335 RepID=A0A6A3BFC7_HIBSY|nr:Detected protein of confused Function [Hibiscus syriacus]